MEHKALKSLEAGVGIEPASTALQAAFETQENQADAWRLGNITGRVLAGFRPQKPLYIPSAIEEYTLALLAASRLSNPVKTERQPVSQVTPNPDDSPRLETNPGIGRLSPPIDDRCCIAGVVVP